MPEHVFLRDIPFWFHSLSRMVGMYPIRSVLFTVLTFRYQSF
jgi:hypothetical protein